VGNHHFIEDIMNKHIYLNSLREHLKTSAEQFGIEENVAFYHDSDPKHSSHLVRGWRLYSGTKVIKTPTQSPDIKMIENLRAKLGTQIKKKHSISSIENLKKTLGEKYERILSAQNKKKKQKKSRIHSRTSKRSNCKRDFKHWIAEKRVDCWKRQEGLMSSKASTLARALATLLLFGYRGGVLTDISARVCRLPFSAEVKNKGAAPPLP